MVENTDMTARTIGIGQSRDPLTLALASGTGLLFGLIAAGMLDLALVLAIPALLIGIAIISRNIEIGLVALVFMIFTNLSDVLIKFHGMPSIAKGYLPLLAVLLFLNWLRTGRVPRLPAPGVAVIGIVIGVLTLSFFYAADTERVSEAILDFGKDLLIALAIAALVWRTRSFRYALWAIIGGALLLGIVNVFQFLSGDFSNDFGGFARAELEHIVGDQQGYRISGPVFDPNFFAQIMLIAVPISFERILSEQNRALKVTAGIAFALTVLCVLFTFSRGALIALGILALIAVVWLRPKPKWLLAGVLVTVAAIPILPSGYVERTGTAAIAILTDNVESADSAVGGRLGEMRAAWEMFADHPLLGVGYNNYQIYFQQYTLALDQRPRGEDRPAHSLYLEIAAEQGLIGIAAFGLLLTYLATVIARGIRTLTRIGDNGGAALLGGFGLGFLAYLIAAIFLHDAYPRFFWMLVGLALAIPGISDNALAEHRENLAREMNPQT